MSATQPLIPLHDTRFPAIRRGRLETLQVNLGYVCNQTCFHCHVNAGPNRREVMDRDTVDLVLDYLRASGAKTLDLTGGAPEMNPHFRDLVREARRLGVKVMDRCNLTILEQPGQDDLAAFLAEHRVEVVASLPCYLEQNVDAQRGDGVFQASIRGLQQLNARGYGQPGSGLVLDLVFNPQGPSLPPPQGPLEADYKRHLGEQYGVVFNQLFTIANMPIHRFGKQLRKEGRLEAYLDLLKGAHRDENLAAVMCRSLISVDWQGYVHDCDFNQMLRMPLGGGTARNHLRALMEVDLEGREIAVADHCFGCTAGQGSSCGGALS
ncbi:radical SAM domain-containing protein [Thioalkalivibrio sulfidiphilus HL-EbGr7]|uniref:Radical SAM domain-containing protein n=1 Tax=Thioalkalivibrio sulfidiphilus (strain HL-EbGR7) TaxID=396588 RepID=B8GPI9_THISH|nr:arsenosugar biosynthesis radical SAM (seleno)protein ArsS [Thioalkalivibrio sulfidiphilus]ACL72156.1 radical SAM domain-containing protein [Thioalkalivibrio sulfidiphilus HL-EbGr7]